MNEPKPAHGRSAERPVARTDRDLAHDRRVAVGVFFLVLAVYVLTYVGAFKSNDERAMFSGTDSFVKRGDFTINQLYWDYTNVGMVNTRGDMVPNYEPAQMVLAIPFYLWGRLLGASVQGVMFYGAVSMALAAAVLYLSLLELGCSRRSGVLGALVFAFATAAWPYSRTFFREPPTALFYLAAVYGLLRYRPPGRRRLGWLALTGAAFGLAYTTKQISIVIVPSLLLLLFAYERHRPPAPGSSLARERIRAALALLLPLALLLALQAVYNRQVLAGVQAFARDIIVYTTDPQLSQSVPIRMLRALLGLTISPYKGLFWYSPVVLLGLVGLVPMLRRRPWECVAFALIVGGYLLGYSRYNYWSGGVAWGSRYMLPVIPFLVLLAVPVWQWLARDNAPEGSAAVASQDAHHALFRGVGVVLAAALIALSVAVQLLGISVDLRVYEVRFLLEQSEVWGGIGQAIEALYLKPAYSPVWGHLKLLLSGTQPLDFAWMQWRPMGRWALLPAGLAVSLLILALALAAFLLIWRRPARAKPVGVATGAAILALCSLLLIFYRHGDARFDPYDVDRFLQPMSAELSEAIRCPRAHPLAPATCADVMLVPDPALTDYFLDHLSAPIVWYGLEVKPVDAPLLGQLTERYGRIWLARDRDAQSDDDQGRREWERYLATHAYKLDEQRFGDWARLLSFSAAGQPVEVAAPHQALGEMVLEQVRLNVEAKPGVASTSEPLDDGRAQLRAGDTLQIGLDWRAAQQPAADYTVFLQLLDGNGLVKAQSDRWPGDGLFPTSTMEAGQIITDNLALPLDVPPGTYHLIAGMYLNDQAGNPRLSGPGGDWVKLAEVNVR
jgi:hypothetical protein